MDENRDIEKVTRTVLENLEMEAGDRAWERLDAELNKRQAALYKRKANRFKLLSAGLAFFLLTVVTCHFYDRSPGTNFLQSEQKLPSEIPAIANANGSKVLPESENAVVNQHSIEETIPHKKEDAAIIKQSFSNSNIPAPIRKDFSYNNVLIQTTDQTTIPQDEELKEATVATIQPNQPPTESNANDTKSIIVMSAANATTENENINGEAAEILDDTAITVAAQAAQVDNDLPNSKLQGHRFSIAGFYAPSYSINQLKDNTNDNFDDVTMYHSREKEQYSYSAGLLLRYDLSDRWSIGAGATFSQTRYSIAVPVMYASFDAKHELHYQYPTAVGVVNMPTEKQQPVHEGDSMLMSDQSIQSVKYLNTPLLIRHQVGINKFTLYAEAGISPAIVLQEKLNMHIGNETTTIVNNIEGLQKINFGFVAGLGAQYNFFPDFGIFLEPTIKGSLSSITKNTAVNAYPHTIGINVGASIRF